MSFTLLPEWSPQDAVMLTWPHKETDWVEILDQVEPVYVALCQHISQVQKVVIVTHNLELKAHILQLLSEANVDMTQIQFVDAPCNDTWARDHGPLTAADSDGNLCIKDFVFNGWGNKYASELDTQINSALCSQLAAPNNQVQQVDIVLEGGGVEINENSVLITTSECLLNPNRNPHLNKEQLEEKLKVELGAKSFLWVEHGYLTGDDTDSHIDTLIRFAPNNTLVYVQCDDKEDEHYASLQAMESQLKTFNTPNGEPYNLVPLPWPSAKYNNDGDRLPATYANYLIINDTVLLPIYGDEKDALALTQLQKAHPERTVIGIDCLPIIHQFGSLHCITMQLPQGFLK
ncbi:agmatine deiminase family protein [Pseudoalteromonas luteoviolacea]|uniref:Agmatine deiminase n=1 Tax=Pseudoalteromonas luteoviolacea NCIMB 1942 TaxID=1365253 RepID=A0A167DFH8_9GAMM|nr:agmatine deiminase family protein [Pseudoalteromonas luteoviolacea]KZN48772.1 agmatine deiminase [Pseudoalteromonas luteoviolacea NCIMB 1942]KZW99518.1 agmatine deiminase [Pseudoalteromonas luteoviolacea]